MNPSFKEVLQSGQYLVLDTETTGLYEEAEICQIAIMHANGSVLLDTLVKPVNPIPAEATAIHGITNENVASAPGWCKVALEVERLLTGQQLVIYNADYDMRVMFQSTQAAHMIRRIHYWKIVAGCHCAMEAFAEIYGYWNEYRQSYTWQKLSTAANYYNIRPQLAHSALADVRTTLAVCQAMLKGAS